MQDHAIFLQTLENKQIFEKLCAQWSVNSKKKNLKILEAYFHKYVNTLNSL